MIQIGVRIPQEDAAFIAALNIENASTPSDKLRAIIAQARKREQGIQNYKETLVYIDELLLPVRNQVREFELQQKIHSELVTRTLDWLGEILSFCLISRTDLELSPDRELLENFEQQLSARLFRILEAVLQMGVTKQSPCYNPDLVADNLQQILDIADVIIKNRPDNK